MFDLINVTDIKLGSNRKGGLSVKRIMFGYDE